MLNNVLNNYGMEPTYFINFHILRGLLIFYRGARLKVSAFLALATYALTGNRVIFPMAHRTD